ncbi:MAG: fabD [Phycisphaerales bacterium]|nr:fabD [Phycisphaerales bacterium]
MPETTYILCPGQGAQHVGMGRDFYDVHPAAEAVYRKATEVLGFDLSQLCFDGPVERLNETDISQPAIYVTSVACHAAAKAAGKLGDGPFIYAGLSLGEYTALHLAGVFSFEDGLKLVAARGKAMQAAAVSVPSSMVAILGADDAAIDKLCADAAGGEVLVPANYNALGQIVVSGSKGACERVLTIAADAGFRTATFPVAGAFHSPIMQPGADVMKGELEKVDFKTPASPVYSNVTAQLHTGPTSIKKLLVDQIVSPVRWTQTMAQVASLADVNFIELAPGKVLTGLLKKQNRRAAVLTLNEAGALV